MTLWCCYMKCGGKVLPECLFGCLVRLLWELTMKLANDFSVCPWISAQESNEPRPRGEWFQCVPWRIDFLQLCSNCIGRLNSQGKMSGVGVVKISLNYDVTVKWDNHTNPNHQTWTQSPLNQTVHVTMIPPNWGISFCSPGLTMKFFIEPLKSCFLY